MPTRANIFGMLRALLLLLPFRTVVGVHEADAAHRGLNVEPDGHVTMQAINDGHLTLDSQGPVMRREAISAMAAKFHDDDDLQHAMVNRHKIAMTAYSKKRLSLPKNVTGQLIQASPLGEEGLKCDTPIFAPADPCPFECPYLAEDSLYICHFRCLTATSCGSLDPLAKIADDDDKICRRCRILGCDACVPGVKDECSQCARGYSSDGAGGCQSMVQYVMFGIKIILAVVLGAGFLWIMELFTRKRSNWRGLKHGLAFRWRTRIHMPLDTQEEDGVDDTDNQDEQIHEQLLYPLSTNLLRQPVAGPGLCLHFNFFVATLVWSAVIIYMYALASCLVSVDMLVLGLTPAKTSQQLCAAIHWGRDAQMRLVWAKFSFVLFAYLFTFFGCLYLSIYQLREFHRLDDETTLKDFVGFCTGLPIAKGSDNPEEDLKKFIQDQTQQKVIGVSICWNYKAKEKEVMQAIEADWKERELVLAPPPPDETINPIPRQPPLGLLRRQLRKLDCLFGFDPPPVPVAEVEGEPATAVATPLLEAAGPSSDEIATILKEMETSDVAFVLFDTEASRNLAVENVATKQGLDYKGSKINLEVKYCEPESARFSGLSYGTNKAHRVKKMTAGVWITLGAVATWGLCFYFPYAYFMTSFSYAHGEEPSMFALQLFSMLVVGGNQLMYLLADVISQRADFAFEDEREVAYNYVYVFACVLNTILDIVVTGWLAYKMMIGAGVHTADDRLLESLTDWREIFEAYPIQKMFGEQIFVYAFPSCFFYPFILEGLGTITLPYYVMKFIVLSHDEVQDRDAELSMQYFLPMNLGRYGDILLNMILAVCVFWCPGGFTLPMFISFLFCHAGIYAYDHYRVLRSTPNFYYANNTVDWFGQIQLIIPTSMLAACCVFRFSQMNLSDYDGRSTFLYIWIVLAATGHSVIHWASLTYIVPLFLKKEAHDISKATYAEIAKSKPLTWYSANPVHCLRSKYLRKEDPPIIHCIYGKEHLQKANPALGAYFQDNTFGGAYQMSKIIGLEELEAKQLHEEEEKQVELDEDEDREP